jgi:hypothetical protein
VTVYVPTARLLSVTFALPPEIVAVVVVPAPVNVSVPVGCVPFTTEVDDTTIFSVIAWPNVAVVADALTVVVVGAVPTEVATVFEVAFR